MRRTRDMKARAEQLSEGYQDAKDYEFNEQFTNFITGTPASQPLTEEDVQGFLDSFTFPDETEWSWNEMESELDDIDDQRYEEEKDRKMGL